MASTFSGNLRLELQATGENTGTWGALANTLFNLLDDAVAGVEDITMADANHTLTASNGIDDDARAMVLNVIGTTAAVRDIILPAYSKVYIIYNNLASGTDDIRASIGGTFVNIPFGYQKLVWTDGTSCFSDMLSTPFLGENLDVNGKEIITTSNGEIVLNPHGTGKVGIRISSPLYLLHLLTDGAGTTIGLDAYGGSSQLLGRVAGGTVASQTDTADNTIMLALDTSGYANSTFTSISGRIGITADELFTVSAEGTRIVFETTPLGSTTRAEVMRISADGDVGIGDTSPSARLDVRKNTTNQEIARFSSDLGVNDRSMSIKSPTSDSTSAPFRFTTANTFSFELDATDVLNVNNTSLDVHTEIRHIDDVLNTITFGSDTQTYKTSNVSRLDLSDSGVRMGAANARVTTILDQDNMSSNSATALTTQQSQKAYIDAVSASFDGITATGTWSPALTFGGGSNNLTYDSQEGTWHRSGNILVAKIKIILTNQGNSAGVAEISLPTVSGYTLTQDALNCTITYFNTMDNLAGGQPWGRVINGPIIRLYETADATAATLNQNNFEDTTTLAMVLHGILV